MSRLLTHPLVAVQITSATSVETGSTTKNSPGTVLSHGSVKTISPLGESFEVLEGIDVDKAFSPLSEEDRKLARAKKQEEENKRLKVRPYI